jgi:hypothetical protein
MPQKPPPPLCKAFLICREIHQAPQFGDYILVGRRRSHQSHVFPTAANLPFFVQVTGAHGDYWFEVQLHDENGDVVWREGPPKPLSLPSPLVLWDMALTLNSVLPRPGDYEFVLTANGEELSRQRFEVRLTP